MTASSAGAPVAAFEDRDRRFAGVQYHPEVAHSPHGQEMLRRFLHDIAGIRPEWTIASIVDDQVAAIRAQVGEGRAICGLSGGVDSAVAAALVQRAIGDRLTCVFVDHGLLRAGERAQVERDFVAATGVKLVTVDARAAVPRRAGRRDRPGAEAQDHRPRVHPRLRAGRARTCRTRRRASTTTSWSRARSTRTWSSPAAAPARRTSRATTTSAGCPRTSRSRWSSRCARCSRTRCAGSAWSWACPRRSCTASRSPVPALASGSSARSPRRGWRCCGRPTRSPARS